MTHPFDRLSRICEKHNAPKATIKWRKGESVIVEFKCIECAKEDLSPLVAALESVFSDYFPGAEKPAMAIAFTLPPDYNHVHWITNVSRENGIELFEATAQKMKRSA